MAKQMQWQAMYPDRRLLCKKWQNLKAKHKWVCGTWLSAEERHTHRQALCKWLQHNCSPGEEYNTRVVLMVRIRQHILGAESTRQVCNVTRRLVDLKRVILCQRVRGSVRNPRVFLMDTMVLADARRALWPTFRVARISDDQYRSN